MEYIWYSPQKSKYPLFLKCTVVHVFLDTVCLIKQVLIGPQLEKIEGAESKVCQCLTISNNFSLKYFIWTCCNPLEPMVWCSLNDRLQNIFGAM